MSSRQLRPVAAAIAATALAIAVATLATSPARAGGRSSAPEPREYVCYRAPAPPTIDGDLGEAAWEEAPWTTDFVDIQGADMPAPRHRTRAKMLWDERYLYIAAEMLEPHLWGTLRERDSVIYRDNDFEVFIDPDGDTHVYYELEINALGTVWDLMLLKPYRDGGPAIDAWEIRGLVSAVRLEGTINDPSDTDRGWSVELALPWEDLEEAAPGGRAPRDGEQWRINFSRVQWRLDVADGGYRKRTDPETGEPLAEDNWVWSPQHAIDMHRPEHWGRVQFVDEIAGGATVPFAADEGAAWIAALGHLYDRQREFRAVHGRFAGSFDELLGGAALATVLGDLPGATGSDPPPRLDLTATGYEIVLTGGGRSHHITADGRRWSRTLETR